MEIGGGSGMFRVDPGTLHGLAGVAVAALGIASPPLEPLAAGMEVAAAGLAAGALLTHGTARPAGADVSDRTLIQDGLGSIPLGGPGVVGGRFVNAIAKSRAADHAANAGLVDSWASLFGDPSSFERFKPQDARQAVQAGIPGGGLLVAFENAWETGSEKDRAAREGE